MLTKNVIFRLMIVLLLAAHVFYMYALARAESDAFGVSLATVLLCAFFGALMLLPFFWLVCLPEFPEILQRQTIGPRRVRAGKCPWCAYPAAQSGSAICAECGGSTTEPEAYEWSWRVVRIFIVMNVLAWFIGSASAETFITLDERTFMRDVETYKQAVEVPRSVQRIRRFPSRGLMLYDITDDEYMQWHGGCIEPDLSRPLNTKVAAGLGLLEI